MKRNFRPRASSLFDVGQLDSTANPELSAMHDTASSNMYITEQPSTAQAEEQQAQQQRLEARLVKGLKTQDIVTPRGTMAVVKVPRLRKISPARRSPAKDRIQILDKSEPAPKVRLSKPSKPKPMEQEEESEDHLEQRFLQMQKRYINTDSSKIFADDTNERNSVLSNIPHKILNVKNKKTNRRQKEALRNFMARYGRYEAQSPRPVGAERISINDQSPTSSRRSPLAIAGEACSPTGAEKEHLKELVLAFGNEELETLLKHVADTISDRMATKGKKKKATIQSHASSPTVAHENQAATNTREGNSDDRLLKEIPEQRHTLGEVRADEKILSMPPEIFDEGRQPILADYLERMGKGPDAERPSEAKVSNKGR